MQYYYIWAVLFRQLIGSLQKDKSSFHIGHNNTKDPL